MLSHERIWAGIDMLARAHDLTPSGLAKRAGLDSTTFNKSKRVAADGRARWPSTESLSKILAATGVPLHDFMEMIESKPGGDDIPHFEPQLASVAGSFMEAPLPGAGFLTGAHSIPVIGMAQAGSGGFFDDAGFPVGEGWDHVEFPGSVERADHVYALEISGDSMLPLYRDGDRIIVSPNQTVRRGDRVVVKTRSGEVMAKILKRKTGLLVELSSANPEHADRQLPSAEIDWIARILWASQ